MAKVKVIQFVPLGRPPKKGEPYKWHAGDCIYSAASTDFPSDSPAMAYERREVEVEVKDEPPEWFVRFWRDNDEAKAWTVFRAHAAERAKAAAKKIGSWDNAESIIVEEFTR